MRSKAEMKWLLAAVLVALPFPALASVELSGTVTDKTTGKVAAGDAVTLVAVQAGLKDVTTVKTDAKGHFSLSRPDDQPYLLRATHEGAGYFVEAPQNGKPVEIAVYDVAPRVDGVFIDEYVVGIVEAANGRMRVVERSMVANNSKQTQWSAKSFEIVLPEEAVVSSAEAQRPGGLPTTVKLDATGAKGHFAFNFPIEPNVEGKGTLFQVEYELPYKSGYSFRVTPQMKARTVWAMLPKGLAFAPGKGSNFISAPQDPSVQTYVAQKVESGQTVEFSITGEGPMPRDSDSASAAQSGDASNGGQPGGGIGAPVATPDPLTKAKPWILGALALILVVVAAVMLRKPKGTAGVAESAQTGSDAALQVLKDELFAIESERAAGAIDEQEYAEVKAAIERLLKRKLAQAATQPEDAAKG